MDYRIIVSDPAITDLENIVRFIARENPSAAARFGKKLLDSVRILAQFPRIGRRVPEQTDENIREIISTPYRVFYQINDPARTVSVIRFWHAARGMPELHPNDLNA